MKTFFLASSFPDKDNPMRGIFNYRFVKQMSELGEDIFVVFFRMWTPRRKFISSYLYNEIKVTQVCLPLIPFPGYVFLKVNNFICQSFGWILLKKQLTLSVLIHSVSLTTNGLIASYWAKKLKLPHIAQAIGSDVNSDMKMFIQKNEYKWLTNIDGIITNSKDLEKSLKALNAICPLKTIYRGIEVKNLKRSSDAQEEGVTFLYLGGLELNRSLEFGVNTKGGITLMEAWKKVESDLYQMKATLFFGGPNSDSNLFRNWKSNLKHTKGIELIGKIDPQEVKKYLSKSTMVIIPSMEEGLPNFLMESAAQGRAAIGSTAGGIPEVIIHGKTGFIFEKGNVDELAALLIQAASNKEDLTNIGQAAYERVKICFNANKYSYNVLNFYKKVMEKCAG